jgi:hypothetical protein
MTEIPAQGIGDEDAGEEVEANEDLADEHKRSESNGRINRYDQQNKRPIFSQSLSKPIVCPP